jgi:glycosyltransferase involved in cell wall biosynthesis
VLRVCEVLGLPPLEAMASGCPVVVSRTAALPEVFDGAAFFCDPNDPEDIAAAIQSAIQPSPAAANQVKSFAQKFTWKKCARETLEVLRSLPLIRLIGMLIRCCIAPPATCDATRCKSPDQTGLAN